MISMRCAAILMRGAWGEMTQPKRGRVRHKTHRLIASRHPAIGVFDDLTADKGDLRAAFLLEALTNDRHLGLRLNLLPDSEIIPGPSGSLVIAAFLHADAAGGRFTDGRLGGWYAGFDRDTAIAETLYHNTRRLEFSTPRRLAHSPRMYFGVSSHGRPVVPSGNSLAPGM